jgi:hypothetical protein
MTITETVGVPDAASSSSDATSVSLSTVEVPTSQIVRPLNISAIAAIVVSSSDPLSSDSASSDSSSLSASSSNVVSSLSSPWYWSSVF